MSRIYARARRALAGRSVLGVAIGVTLAAAVGQLLRPWSFIDDDITVALVSADCSISHEVVQSVAVFPEARQAVMTVPIDTHADAGSEFRLAACGDALAHVRDRAPWLHLAPSEWLCDQLSYDAARVHREHFVGVPAYVREGEPLDETAFDEHLDEHGLVRRRGVIVPQHRLES